MDPCAPRRVPYQPDERRPNPPLPPARKRRARVSRCREPRVAEFGARLPIPGREVNPLNDLGPAVDRRTPRLPRVPRDGALPGDWRRLEFCRILCLVPLPRVVAPRRCVVVRSRRGSSISPPDEPRALKRDEGSRSDVAARLLDDGTILDRARREEPGCVFRFPMEDERMVRGLSTLDEDRRDAPTRLRLSTDL